MLRPEYIEALETRVKWLQWAQSDAGWASAERLRATNIFPKYRQVLADAELFCMTPHFASLVDDARRTVPDDLDFDIAWLQAPSGFLFLNTPFEVPQVDHAFLGEDLRERQRLLQDLGQLRVRAMAWMQVPQGTRLWNDFTKTYDAVSEPNTVQVLCFQDMQPGPGLIEHFSTGTGTRYVDAGQGDLFNCWSYWTITDGDRLGTKIAEFESKQQEGRYARDLDRPESQRVADPLHEMRWWFTAAHLMAQRLAIEVKTPLDRATRRRQERAGSTPPPFIRVVTLRRQTLHPQHREPAEGDIDWQFSWTVRGHWRQQWYPSLGLHKKVFIEAYVKGPPEKPLKPGSVRIYGVSR